ncbi:MAG: hypothetical protein ACI3Y0_00485 [Prevotella sp.]
MREKPIFIDGEGLRNGMKESHNRRLKGHDYSDPGAYMLTIVTEGRMPLFGTIEGNIRAERMSKDWPHLNPSPLGKAVFEEEAPKISKAYPMVELWRITIMPDHIHMIIYIRKRLPEGKTLGNIVAGFKGGCSRAWWRLQEEGEMPLVANATSTGAANRTAAPQPAAPQPAAPQTAAPQPAAPQTAAPQPAAPQQAAPVQATSVACVNRSPLFSPGYNDRILKNSRQLQTWKDYLIDNPYRLLVRRTLPSHFQHCLDIKIGDETYSAFGNFLLLKKPEKLQVFCHRKARFSQLTEEEKTSHDITYLALPEAPTGIPYTQTTAFQKEKDSLLDAANSGIPLVTPGISEGEKIIMNACIKLGLPLIHIQQEKINDQWKPEKSRFEACISGHLLILIPKTEDMNAESRHAKFHSMNDLAKKICSLDTITTSFTTTIHS